MESVTQALILALLGMGWVFLFLGILVVFMILMSRVTRLFPQEEPAAKAAVTAPSASSEAEVVAAIAAAKAHQNTL